ncbi:transposase [Corynebacterium striatum]
MPRYSEQFRRDAVALYENNEDLSLHAASAELGVNRSSLFSWLQQYGTGKRARTKAMVKSADVVYEFFRIVGDRLAGIGSGTGLGVVGH